MTLNIRYEKGGNLKMTNKRGSNKRKQDRIEHERIDKKHRFTLRIDEALHCEISALAFNHNMSENLLYVEMIKYAKRSFQQFLIEHEQYKRDDRRGHFVYLANESTLKSGKVL
jgi:hypothetical protein